MQALKTIGLFMLLLFTTMALYACGSSSGENDGPELPIPGDFIGGDLRNPGMFGEPPNPFEPRNPPQFNNLRGIAMSSRFIYIADQDTISLYRHNGAWLARVPSPYGAIVQAIAVVPEQLELTLPENVDHTSPFAGLPVVLHNPVPGQGYVTVLPPNLDGTSTIEDLGNVDMSRLTTYPGRPLDRMSPPAPPPDPASPPFVCQEVVDLSIDPFGSFLVTNKVLRITPDGPEDAHGHLNDPPRWHVGLQVFNRFNDYAVEPGGGMMTFHKAWGHSIGNLGNMAVGKFATPRAIGDTAEFKYLLYSGDAFSEGDQFLTGGGNFVDFVGRTWMNMNLDTLPPSYSLEPMSIEAPYYDQIFGVIFGEKFSPWPNGDDPDLTAGGPSGMFVRPEDDTLYICDPGNDRILVYSGFEDNLVDGVPGDPNDNIQSMIEVISADEPSEVMVDRFDRTFILDNDTMIPPTGQPINTVYGNIGGTVRDLELGIPLIGARVNLRDEFISTTTGTDLNGDYIFRNVPYGQYLLTATMRNHTNDSFVATIVVDETIRVDMNLPGNEPGILGEYQGVVFGNDTQSFLSGVTVSLVGFSKEVVTGTSGQFIIPDIGAGTYQAIFMKDGYITATKDVEIIRGEITNHPAIFMDRLPLF